jgi:Ran GTPase-activating protein (RanGAP) involved in mRNA processing and transport
LSDNGLDAASIEQLSLAGWKKLEKLNLSFNYLGNQGLSSLEANKWRSLRVLSLLSNGINNRGASSIVRMNFPFLDQLLLSHNQLTDDCAQVLVKGHWPQLKVLDLDDNFLGDAALKSLARLGCYKLQKLNLFDGKTVIINNTKDPKVFPTMGGLKELVHGNFEQLRVEIPLGKLGEVSKSKFIKCTEVKDMLENGHIDIALVSLGKSSC